MSTEANKAIVQDYYDHVWNNGRLEYLDELLAEEVVEHPAQQIPGLNGRDSLKAIIGGARGSLPDMEITVHDLVAEGSKVVTRYSMTATHRHEFMGAPATGKQLATTGVAIFRLTGGRIVEIWNFLDTLGLMQQLGLIATPEAA
jgi:steroid delta-isomerase-like uncharacterized protein